MNNTSDNDSVNTLETERLILRPLRADDYEALCILDMNPEVRSYFPEGF